MEYSDSLNLHDYVLTIFLKPGHYDILYSKQFLRDTELDNFEDEERSISKRKVEEPSRGKSH